MPSGELGPEASTPSEHVGTVRVELWQSEVLCLVEAEVSQGEREMDLGEEKEGEKRGKKKKKRRKEKGQKKRRSATCLVSYVIFSNLLTF